ncbi:ABC transporter ATP-binding protein [Leucobacter tenebrionis]|uniref:ABC transporter ATP-binding protein n=1 Tax=Leucobacter tenebrionis TaxID=2873270 RepID=UPI001CA794A7|nr:ABC transporter ATP-binding protein [Leucobacter tenebrionis]QZY51160.1 ATP-binding cassette domain-containing protein [Leucobacter tenebrionis]
MPNASDHEDNRKPAIVFEDVCKSFNINHTHSFKESFVAWLKRKQLKTSFNAVDHLSLQVAEGESIAIMGRNGSGKSTTLKLLSGVLRPDQGWVRTRGRIAGLLEVGAGFHPDLSGRQNVYLNAAILGMSKEETDERFESILEFSEIGEFIDTEVKRYSSGMYARLGFSVAVHTEVDVLLVDEVLSVGDAQFRQKCDQKMMEMREQGKTMFIVSHSVSQVRRLCERGVVLDHGRIVFDGPIEEAVLHLNGAAADSSSADDDRFPITGDFAEVYLEKPGRFGKPLGPRIETDANGGGSYQEFQWGIITSYLDGDERRTVGLTRDIFLTSYLKHGGPTGPWGYLAGHPYGGWLEDDKPRMLDFQNGTATFTLEDGLTFAPREQPDAQPAPSLG